MYPLPKKILYLKFWDHIKDHDKPAESHFLGWLIKETKDYYVLSPWVVADLTEEEFKNNLENYTILKSTIIKKKVMKI